MRRFSILAGLLLAACEAEPPLPGDVVGTFEFKATLERDGACVLEDLAEVPQSFAFTAVLSHEAEAGRLWLRSGATEQTGTLEENRFSVRTPAEGSIPRQFAACSVARGQPCAFRVVEFLAGEILSHCPEVASRQDASELPCPEQREDGTLLWHNCACVRGTLEEVVRFEPEGDETCTCTGRTRTETIAGECRLVYRLHGFKQ